MNKRAVAFASGALPEHCRPQVLRYSCSKLRWASLAPRPLCPEATLARRPDGSRSVPRRGRGNKCPLGIRYRSIGKAVARAGKSDYAVERSSNYSRREPSATQESALRAIPGTRQRSRRGPAPNGRSRPSRSATPAPGPQEPASRRPLAGLDEPASERSAARSPGRPGCVHWV
jgi:hypothetical protein